MRPTLPLSYHTFQVKWIRLGSFLLLIFWFTHSAAWAQCTGCTSNVTTNTAITFSANNQVICLSPASALNYNSNVNFGSFTNVTLCVGSNVTWSGGSLAGSNYTIINNGSITRSFTNLQANQNIQNKSGGSISGSVTLNGGSVTNDGTFSPGSYSHNSGTLTLNSDGTATMPGFTVSNGSVVNNGDLTINGSFTINSTGSATLGGSIAITGALTNNNVLSVSGTLDIGGNLVTNSSANTSLTGTTSVGGSVTNNGTFAAGQLDVTGSLTNNGGSTATLNGPTSIGQNVTNNGTINLNGPLDVDGNVTNNGSGSINGSGATSGCSSICPTGTITNYGNLTGVSVCKSVTGGTSNAFSGGSLTNASGCSGSNSGTLTLSGQNGTLLRWESSPSPSFSPATTITNTSNSQSFSNLTETTYYRAVTDAGDCGFLYSTTGTFTVNNPGLSTSTISGSPFCVGTTTASVNVPYTISGCAFLSGNVFTAQLSDASGSFASPTNIGTRSSTTAGTITASIPAGTPTGNGYRIRVVSSNPAVTGTINGANLTINGPLLTTLPTNQVRCGNGTVTFNAVPATGSSVEWSTTAAFTTFSTGNSYTTASITAPNSITIYYRAGVGTCKGTVSSVTATAGAVPAVPTVPTPATICAGSTATITPNTQSGVLFDFYTTTSGGTALNASPAASYDVSPTSSTTYYVEAVNTTTGCKSTSRRSVTVSVNAAPTAFNVTGGGTFCSGGSGVSVGLSGSQVTILGGSVFMYQLQNNGVNVGSAIMGWGFPISFGNQTAAGTYTVVATNAFTGCSQTMNGSATVTVNPIPTTPTASSNTPVCLGNSISLSTAAVTGATYSWTGPNGFTSSQQNPTVSNNATAAMAGNYSLTITVNGCTSAAGSTNVVITNRPTASISGTATICNGSSTPISVALTGAAPWSITYTDGTTPTTVNGINSSPYTFNVSPASTRTYSLTAVSNAICTGTVSGSAPVTVKPVPTVTNSPLSKTICSGASVGVNLTASVASSTFAWTGTVISGTVTGVTASSTSNAILDNLTNTGTTAAVVRYTITATGPGPAPFCTGPAVNYDVTVNPTPAVTNNPLSKSICSGSNTGIALTSGVSGASFTWTASVISGTVTGFSSGSGTAISQVLSNTTTAAGVVRYVITPSANGCTGTAVNYDVTVNPLPTLTLGTISAICPGSSTFSIPYTATTNGANQYSLVAGGANPMPGFTAISNATLPASPISVSIPATAAGTYTFTLTLRNSTTGCGSANYAISLSVGPAIANNTITSDQNICSDQTAAQLTGSVASGGVGTLTYLWESSTTSATTGFAAAAGTNNTQNYQPAFASQNTWYRRTVTDACGTQNVSSSVLVSLIPAPGDPAAFGNGVWNVYAYDNYNITATTGSYRGYYTEPSLTFDSGTRWNANTGSPSDASGYQGCPVAHDYLGAVYKRTGFDGNTYVIDITGHDDDAYLLINGVQVWGHAGCCDSHPGVWMGILKPTTTVEFRWRNGQGPTFGRVTFTQVPTPTSINPGAIGYDEIICPGNTPTAKLNASPASGGCYATYQWQVATDLSGSGNWADIPGATSLTYTPTAPVTQTTYFRRVVSDACDLTAATAYATTNIGTTAGNPAIFGNGVWNVYCYDGGNGYGYTNPLYLGYYVETSLNFDSRNRWVTNGTPSSASGYQGCQVPNDYHVVSYRRQNFTPGTYQLDIPFHDDNVYLYINGTLVFSHIGYGDAHPGAWIGPLDASSTVELRWSDNGAGQSAGVLNLTIVPPPTALIPGTIGSDQTICPGETPVLSSLTPASGGCYPGYQWQVATDIAGSGNWADIAGATSLTYTPTAGITQTTYFRRMATDACGNTPVYTPYVTVTMGSTQGDPAVFGNNTWNVYAYSYPNGQPNNTSYLGYYVEPSLSFDSRSRWGTNGTPSSALGYQGCQVGVDYHIVSYKRQGFTPGTYQLDVASPVGNGGGHDDDVWLYVNGALVFSHTGCCDSHTNVWTGNLDATSTVELRWREGNGSSYGAITVTPITPTIPLTPGTIGPDQTICNGGNAAALTNVTSANSTCTISYQWQSSNDNATWTNISGGTAATYTIPSGMTQTTYFRRGVTDACAAGPLYSNVVTITVYQALTAGTIGSDQTICTGTTPAALTSQSLPTGANGTYTYSWQSSTNGVTWSGNITGATGATYAPGSLTTTTYYRRNVTTTCVPATTVSTTPVLITVTPLPTAAGSITGSNAVCQNTSGVTYTVTAFANATSYTWTYSGTGATSTSGSFTTASNSITLNYSSTATSGTLTVRGSNGCGNSTGTLTLPITVNTGAAGNAGAFTSGLPTTVCQGATAVTYSLNANVSNAASYTWTLPSGVTQNGTGASGTVVTTTRSITVDFAATAASGSLIVRGTNGCGSGATNSLAVTVNPLISNNTISSDQTLCAGQTAATLTGTTPSGGSGTYTYQWQSSPNNSTWTTIGGATSASYTFGAGTPSTTTWYRRVVNTTGTGCSNISAAVQITVNPAAPSAAGAISGTADLCQGATGIVYTVPAITNATSYVWSFSGTGVTSASGSFTTPSNTISLHFSGSATSGTLTVRGNNSCGNGTVSAGYSVVVSPGVPANAGTISGANTVCQGQNGVVYSVPAIANATSYSWTVPTGATITSGANTNSITVDFSATAQSGNISVNGVNGCGSGVSANYALVVNPLPLTAGSISGSATVCQGQNGVMYTVPAITNATSYVWTYSGTGVTVASGTFTTATPSLTVNFAAGATSGSFAVTGSNTCGNGTASATYSVTVSPLPLVAGSISGPASVCQSQTGVVYTVPVIANATSYVWSVPSGGTIVAGAGSNSITVNYSVLATSGNVTVYGRNACGDGTTSSMAVTVGTIPAAAGTIVGTAPSGSATAICRPLNGVVYTVPVIAGATSYYWTLPTGVFSTSGSNVTTTNSITVDFNSASAASGNITVYGNNACGNGTFSSLYVSVSTGTPSTAGTITGTNAICRPTSAVTYTVPAIGGATSYTWTLPGGVTQSGTGASGTVSTATNTITVDFGNATAAGNNSILARGINACGVGNQSSYTVTVYTAVPTGTPVISGTATVCQGQNGVTYTVSGMSSATSYTWSLPAGASPASGTLTTTTNSITVNYANGASSGNVSVTPANPCGSSAPSANYAVTVNPLPDTPGSITGTSLVCQGTNTVTYSVPAINNATQYVWSLPTGVRQSVTNATGVVTTAANSITVDFTTTSVSGNVTVNGRNGGCGNGPAVSFAVTVSTPGTWLGGSSDDWNNPANWCGGVPSWTTNVTISTTTAPPNWPVIRNAPTAMSNHLTINAGASVSITGNFTLDMKGNLTNNGTFSAGSSGTVTLSGNATQTLSGSPTFNNLTISGGGTKTLAGNITVNGILSLQSGLVSTNSYQVNVTNSASTAVSGYSAVSYIDGTLQRAIAGSGSYDWPVGAGVRYAPINLNIPAATPLTGTSRIAGFFTYNVPAGASTLSLSEDGNAYTSLCGPGYWTLNPDVQPSSGNFSLTITPPSGMTCSGTQSTIVKRPNSAGTWGFYGSTSFSSVRRNGYTSFSEIAQATGNAVSLPVRLLSFTGQINQGVVYLKWTTLSEKNNLYFDIERSANLVDYETIGQIKGAGTTNERIAYGYADRQPLPGISYYRLRQVDTDGHFTLSAPIAIDNTNAQLQVEVYPNPIPRGNDIQVKITTSQATSFSLDLYDLHGRRLHQETYQAKVGASQLTLKRHHTLPAGVYLLRMIPVNPTEGQPVRTFKLTVE